MSESTGAIISERPGDFIGIRIKRIHDWKETIDKIIDAAVDEGAS